MDKSTTIESQEQIAEITQTLDELATCWSPIHKQEVK